MPECGTTFSTVPTKANAIAVMAALESVVAKDAPLVSNAGTGHPSCALSLEVSHETLNRFKGERGRGSLYIQTASRRPKCPNQFRLVVLVFGVKPPSCRHCHLMQPIQELG